MYSSKVIPGVSIATAEQYNNLRADAMASSYLLAHAQSIPDDTFRVEAGFWYSGSVRVDVAQYDSIAVFAPITSDRIDLISCTSLGVITITPGTEGMPAPTIPAGNFPVAEIYCRVGGTLVLDEDDTVNHYIIDVRQSLSLGGSGSGTGTLHVDLIFDDHLNDLPATTATQIDGTTVTTGLLVYVKDCSDALKIGNTYMASVVGVNITRTFSSTVLDGTWVYATYGTVYNNNVIISGATTVTNLGDVVVNNINITGGTAVLTGSWNVSTFTGVTTTVTLPSIPVDQNAVFINLPPTLNSVDYSVNMGTGEITFSPSLGGADIEVKYMVASNVAINGGTGFKTITGTRDVSVDANERLVTDTEILANSNYFIQFVGTQPSGQIDSSIINGVITMNSSVLEPVDLTYKLVLFVADPITMNDVKPSQLKAINSAVDGYVAKKATGSDDFEWVQGTNGTDTGNSYLVLDGTLVDIGATAELVLTDTRITDVTPYLLFRETQPVGNITKTLVNGELTISSDDDADTLYVKVVFLDIGPSRQYMKGTAVLTGVPGVVATILDPRFDTTTPGVVMPITTPVGYVTAVMSAGQMAISSTGTEVGCVVNRVVFLDTVNYSDGMPYNATLDDDDMFFRKGNVSGDDEAVKWSDMKTTMATYIQPLIGNIIGGTTNTVYQHTFTYGNRGTTRTPLVSKTITVAGEFTLSGSLSGTNLDTRVKVNGIVVATGFSNAGFTHNEILAVGDVVTFEGYDNFGGGNQSTVAIKFAYDYSGLAV